MAKRFHVARHIDAPPQAVWEVLTDAGRIGSSRYGITSLEGELRDGGRLRLKAAVSGDRTFPLRVSIPEPGRRMLWESGLPLGLFRGRREFRLTPEAGGTRFDMEERFTGLLSGLIVRSIPDLAPSFEAFAAALDTDSRRES